MTDAAVLKLALLGPLVIEVAEEPIRGLPKAARAVLAYLAVHRGSPISRERLATLLWPETEAALARQRLRAALLAIRESVPPDALGYLHTDSRDLRLTVDAAVDTWHFDQLVRVGAQHDLAEAAELYRGEFLTDMPPVSPEFDEWASVQRVRYHELMCDILERLAERQRHAGDHVHAIRTAQRLVALDRLSEAGHRALMRAYVAAGRLGSARKQYQECADLLRRELQVTPAPETAALLREIEAAHRSDPPSVAVPAAPADPRESIGPAPTAAAPRPAPKRGPSLAVLPFENIGNGADHAYFADGVVDELITALSRVRGFFVLSRSSSFVYRSRPARDLGQELGVRYVLEGSIRRAGERVRITAKLLDAEQDHHIWADRIDGELQDIFDLQDRITQQVVCAIEPKIRTAELERARNKAPENLDAYDLYLQALPHLYDVSRTSNSEARRLLREAINRDASYALACGLLAFCLQQAKQQGWAERSAELDREGVNLAEVAVRLDPEDPRVLWTAGHVFSTLGRQPTRGRHLIDQSLTSNPNSFPAWCISGWNHIYVGEGRAALLDLERAQRLSPLDPMLYYLYSAFSAAYLNLREYELARHWAERSIQERPRQTSSLRFLAVALAYLGEIDRARGVVASMLELDPALTVTVVAEARTNQTNPEDKARFLEGLRLAGLPE